MPVVTPEKLAELQWHPDDVRNICILAHVDHGKTSLTDSLLATNGVISPKLAGKVRYMDSRPDEQLRGITMKSSAISLYFSMLKRSNPAAEPMAREYLINLIDSPGHVDFSSEVSTASRLCDGAVVLVDAVDGVCSQTVTVLRQTWDEKLKPLLVINKMDRLIMELKMTPSEAFDHLTRLLEQVNAVLGTFFQGDRMEEDLNWRERMEERLAANVAKEAAAAESQAGVPDQTDFQERDDEELYFAPEKNNVVFASAIDGWAFTVQQFAVLYERKLGMKRQALQKVLWGSFYLDPKTKKVLQPQHLKGRNLKPLFVQLVLDQIWAVYTATIGGDQGRGDPELLDKIIRHLDLTIPPRILRSRDQRQLLLTVFWSWLPLSTALLVSVIESLPSPRTAQAERLPELLEDVPGIEHVDAKVRDAMVSFKDAKVDLVVAYVSKLISVPTSDLPDIKHRGPTSPEGASADYESAAEETPPDAERLIGFARIYSGTLSVGDSVYVLSPKFNPATPHAKPQPKKIIVRSLYMFMGRNLEALESVPAGVVFGIGGLEDSGVLKACTLCSQLEGSINLAGLANAGSHPIVQVALEPADPFDYDKMIAGLKLLTSSDPCAEYQRIATGQHVLLTAGELHLERCLTDLRERFAKCDIQAGESIVPFRETIVQADEMRPPENKDLGRGAVIAATKSQQASVAVRVRPLPADVTDFLVKHASAIHRLQNSRRDDDDDRMTSENHDGQPATDTVTPGADHISEARTLAPDDFKDQLRAKLESAGSIAVDQIVSFGPDCSSPNLLIDQTPNRVFTKIFSPSSARGSALPCAIYDRLMQGFQNATARGPLCHEPVQGISVSVEDVNVTGVTDAGQVRLTQAVSNELTKAFEQAVHQGFLDWSPRIMLAMYSVDIQAKSDVLGRVYDVLTRRRSRVLAEIMKEGTPFITIVALLPVVESFGFADEMRKRTSGAAQPQLVFAGYEIVDEDPLWQPFTEDDLEDLGEIGDRENVAKVYVDAVRRRKGLRVGGRNTMRDAEKQNSSRK